MRKFINIIKNINWLILLAIYSTANANELTVKVNGRLPVNVKQNVLSYVGSITNDNIESSVLRYNVKDNVLRSLKALGYYRSEVVLAIEESTKQLNIDITLNEPTLIDTVAIDILGDAKSDSEFISAQAEHKLNTGEVLHHGHYSDLKSRLLSLATRKGYFDAKFIDNKIAIKQDYQFADIILTFDSGKRYKFGDVTFSEFNLDPDLLSDFVPFNKNDYYTAKKYNQFQHQLQASGYFASSLIEVNRLEESVKDHDYQLPIQVLLTPTKSHLLDFGVGYATDTNFRFSATINTPLINKYGHFQETKFQYSKVNPTGRFTYSIPLSHPVNDLLQLKLSIENDEYIDVTTKFYSAQIGRTLSKGDWQSELYFRYHREGWNFEQDSDSPSFSWEEADTSNYYIPGVTWSKTKRYGSAVNPSAGFRQTYNIEGGHSKVGSDNSFFRLHGRWQHITSLAEKHRLVSRAELGVNFIKDDAQLPPSLLFYAGGDQSIRGFAYHSIGTPLSQSSLANDTTEITVGGTSLVVASLEYQYYINNNWRVALFSDGGNVASNWEFTPAYSIGSGLHYITPVGALKFYLAYGIHEDEKAWRLHINIGAEL